MASTIRTDKVGPADGSADFTLPTADGSAKSALITDGSKALSFATGTPSASNFLRGDGTWAAAGGLSEFDMWYLPTSFTGSVFPITTMTRLNFGPEGAPVGTGMGHSSGTFSFPSTGKWLITFHMMVHATTTADDYCVALLKTSINTGGAYVQVAEDSADTPAIGSGGVPEGTCNMTSIYLMDVTNITTHLVQIGSSLQTSSNTVVGASAQTNTNVTFMKVAS